MGSVLQFPSGKASFKRNKHKRLERQRALLDEIFNQPYTTWVASLVQHWPNGLPNVAWFDDRMSEAVFEEYTMTSLRRMLAKQGVQVNNEQLFEGHADVYSKIADQMLQTYEHPLENLVRSIQDIPGSKTVFARILNPMVYDTPPSLDDDNEEWEWMMASADWDALNPWNGNLDWLAVVACGIHLEGTVFVHQKTGMSFERDGNWVEQEKVFGFVLFQGHVNSIPVDKAKTIYAMDPVTCAPRVIPNHLSFGEAAIVRSQTVG